MTWKSFKEETPLENQRIIVYRKDVDDCWIENYKHSYDEEHVWCLVPIIADVKKHKRPFDNSLKTKKKIILTSGHN